MIATIFISSVTFILVTLSILFFPKVKIGNFSISTYWIISLIGALVLLIAQLAPVSDTWAQLTSSTSVNPIKIIVLFFSMTVISIFLDEVGLFKYLANQAVKKTHGNQFVTFTVFFLLIAALTIFTSNDIVILTFTPFICCYCKNSKINPIPYLVAEFVAANTWSMMLIIGNPTNIYLATSFEIGFFDYFKVMALPTLAAGVVEYLVLILVFHRKLAVKPDISTEEYHIENKAALIIGLVHLFVCLVFLVISSYTVFEMWLVSFISASSLLLCTVIMCLIKRKDWNYITGSLKKLPYQLIPFFLSMFVIVVALNVQGVTAKIAELLSNTNQIWSYGLSSLLISNLINNIPMSILFSNIATNKAAVFASIVGSNIGAFLTPTGALAGIMFTGLVNKHETKYSFVDFIKYGVIVTIPVISITLFVLSFTVLF